LGPLLDAIDACLAVQRTGVSSRKVVRTKWRTTLHRHTAISRVSPGFKTSRNRESR
jgi:hypothetical protein